MEVFILLTDDSESEGRPISAKKTPPLKTRAANKRGERNVKAKKGKKRAECASLSKLCCSWLIKLIISISNYSCS